MKFPSSRGALVALLLAAPTPPSSEAVILYRKGDPAANTSAPTGTLSGSGWQFEGIWGAFLGTPVAPHFFLSAQHIGQAGAVLTFGGADYTLVKAVGDPNSDLARPVSPKKRPFPPAIREARRSSRTARSGNWPVPASLHSHHWRGAGTLGILSNAHLDLLNFGSAARLERLTSELN